GFAGVVRIFNAGRFEVLLDEHGDGTLIIFIQPALVTAAEFGSEECKDDGDAHHEDDNHGDQRRGNAAELAEAFLSDLHADAGADTDQRGQVIDVPAAFPGDQIPDDPRAGGE